MRAVHHYHYLSHAFPKLGITARTPLTEIISSYGPTASVAIFNPETGLRGVGR